MVLLAEVVELRTIPVATMQPKHSSSEKGTPGSSREYSKYNRSR